MTFRIVGRTPDDWLPPKLPGDPVSWAAITAGTVLDGVPYPGPPSEREGVEPDRERFIASLARYSEPGR